MAIVKILARHSPSYASLIKYILNEAKADKLQMFTNNLRSNSVDEYVQEFITNEAFRKQSRSDQIYLFHEIVSFSADENNTLLTPELLDDLAHEYMRLRGNTGVMLGAVHRDKGHVHIHFCVSALHFCTGKSFGLSKVQLLELKSSFQKYHQLHYPELSKSAPAHGRGGRYVGEKEWRAKQREQIIDRVQECFAKARSQSDFLALLREADLHHYERNGKPTGIEYEGVKFRFSRLLDGDGFDTLPLEQSEEQKALEAISALRASQQERERAERNGGDRER